MKVALCSTIVPFIGGGARNIVEWLETMLLEAGHSVERVYLPMVDTPELLFRQMAAFRFIDLSMADRIICFRPQSHLIQHTHKILWFIHHIRVLYDLWQNPGYCPYPDDFHYEGVRAALRSADNAALHEAEKIFTNSKVISNRLKKFNQVESEVLYPPVFRPERFQCNGFNNEIVCVCRMEPHKRQHLLVEAMRYTRTPVVLRLCGTGSQSYLDELRANIHDWHLEEKVIFDARWIQEEEKVSLFGKCLAAAYLPLDEDSYGYPSVEASLASKSVLTVTDSGGVPELVQDGLNGFITSPEPQALAEAMDILYGDRKKAEWMGENARNRLAELNLSWEHVLRRLLA